MNDCKDCIYIDNLSRRVSELEKDVESIKKELIDIRVTNERFEEKFDRLFDSIKKIEVAIEKISDKIEEIEKRPANNWDKIITALISGAVAFLITQIMK